MNVNSISGFRSNDAGVKAATSRRQYVGIECGAAMNILYSPSPLPPRTVRPFPPPASPFKRIFASPHRFISSHSSQIMPRLSKWKMIRKLSRCYFTTTYQNGESPCRRRHSCGGCGLASRSSVRTPNARWRALGGLLVALGMSKKVLASPPRRYLRSSSRIRKAFCAR